ncbi:hypothetical protein Daus18300_004941 [Diaporthe australafricana]|uniref:Uncharacterized protein n=1 Tax=Diaporthe australafricana TaxID=127596 RepID=A0ABR3X571_9PEZI
MLFRLRTLLALAIFSLNASAYYLGQWGLRNFAITCPDDDVCTYNFRIIRGIDTPDQFHRYTDCNFTVERYYDFPASQVNMTNHPCNGTDDRDEFRVSGMWDPHGSITFCITHSWAYFGYETWQILNTNASWMSVSPCYQIGTFNHTDRPPGYPVNETAEAEMGLIGEAEGGVDMPVTAVDDDEVENAIWGT